VRSPFDRVPPGAAKRTARKDLLIEVSKHLERQAVEIGGTAVILSTFRHGRHLTPLTQLRYQRLVAAVGFVAVFGDGIGSAPIAGVRGARLEPTDRLCHERDVVVLAPHFSAALLARDLDTAPGVPQGSAADNGRLFEFFFTHDRAVVAGAAADLMARVASVDEG
jgi:DICT domain-containing protein